jgi:peptide subunit release factor 1 (eRF1)
VAPITDAAIKELAAFRSTDSPVVSVYLDVDGRRQILRNDVERQFEALVRDVQAHPDASGAAEDLRRIADFLGEDLDRSGVRGLAIFACAAHGLWRVVPLPVPVAATLHLAPAPAVGQLEAVVQELEPLGLLLVDRQRARMFVYHLGDLIDRTELFDVLPRNDFDRHDDASRGADRHEHHLDEAVLRHLRHAVDVAFGLFQDHGFDHLAIGGADDLLGTVEGLLHPYLRERLCGHVALTVGANDADVCAAAVAIEHEVEQAKEAALVQRLRDAVGTGTRGAAGLAGVLGALAERRVAVLLVSQGFVDGGWTCASCGGLFVVGPSCPVDGSAMSRVDDVVEAAVQQAMAQGATVDVCIGNADLDVMGRIGALLRY